MEAAGQLLDESYWSHDGRHLGSARLLALVVAGLVTFNLLTPRSASRHGWAITVCDARQALSAAGGGADRRAAKNADAPMNQSREAHHPARPLHSPEGGHQPPWEPQE